MKLTVLGMALLVAIISSCSNSEDLDNKNAFTAVKVTRYTEPSGVLSFPSEMVYEATLDSLSSLSDSALLQWESRYKGFTSMYRLHSEAISQILQAKNKREYEILRKKYSKDFLFNDIDESDLSIYMPVSTPSKAITLNKNGYVMIGGILRDMRDFKTYEEYNANHQYQENQPSLFKYHGPTIENGYNEIYVQTKNRKFHAGFGISFGIQGIQVNASKKFLWGWIEYKTAYYWQHAANGPILGGQEYKSGSVIHLPYSLPDGAIMYMWTRGTGQENRALMTIHY